MENFKVETAIKLFQKLKKNILVYETVYLYVYYICPYWIARAAINIGNSDTVTDFWRYFIHLFIATGKFKYTIMCFKFLWVLCTVHLSVKEIYQKYRFYRFSGEPGTAIPLDGLIELVSAAA